MRAYAFGLATTTVVLLFAVAEWWTEKYVSDHSRLAGTAIEITIVLLATLAFRPIHRRVEEAVEAAFTRRRREARDALVRLQKQLTAFGDAKELLRAVVEAVDRHMLAGGCAIYLRYDVYRPEASSYGAPLGTVALDDPLVLRFGSQAGPADPRAAGSEAAGELAFPMMAGGGLVGFLTLTPDRIELEPDDRAVLAALAEATGLALVVLDPLGTLPAHLSLVDSRHLYAVSGFCGRDEELRAIDAALEREESIAVVYGLGGVGKSSVAREYAWRNRERYSVTWWLNAQTEDGVIDGLVRLGSMFVRGLDQLADRGAAAQRVVNSVLSGFEKPVLLVFDNLEDEALVRTWLPRAGARALVTSRNAAWSPGVTAIALHEWNADTAGAYLQNASGRSDLSAADARAIVQSLGALPLALAHAAAALRNLRMVSPQRYLEHLTTHLKNAPHGAEYPRSVFATFNTAIVQAEEQAPGAAAVLCFAASFAPDAIPAELFGDPVRRCPDELRPALPGDVALDLRAAVADGARLDQALGALDRLSLLSFEQRTQTYSVHRLVQLAARDLVNDAAAWAAFAVDAVRAAFPRAEFSTWPQCARVLSHARAALDALPLGAEPLAASDLARRCANYLFARGDYAASEQLCTRALAIAQNALGPDHLDVMRALNNLAVVYMELGRFEEAEPLLTRALNIREKALGPNHPDVATALHNLAIAYMELGRHAEAGSLHTRALEIREKAFGPSHPDALASLTGLGVLRRTQGRYADAEALLARVVEIQERELGPDHPDVALSLMQLADVYAESGRGAEAEPRYARALAILESTHEAFGPNHPDVAECLKGLARVYRDRGRDAEAQAMLARALAIREKTFGPDHRLTKATREAIDAIRLGRPNHDAGG